MKPFATLTALLAMSAPAIAHDGLHLHPHDGIGLMHLGALVVVGLAGVVALRAARR